MKYNFCYFILSHERADNIQTYKQLKKLNTKYPVFILIDDTDSQQDLYKEKYGDKVIIFNKKEYKTKLNIDMMDNFENMINCVIPRNYCFYIAKRMGFDYFAELDDDYNLIQFRIPDYTKQKLYGKNISNFDNIIDIHLNFLENTPTVSLAFAQGGDYVGGIHSQIIQKQYRRKAMNFIFHKTNRPVKYIGTLNDDVTAYTHWGSIGQIYLTFSHLNVHQPPTQQQKGGLTDAYQDGTYLKTIYSLLPSPRQIKITYHPGMNRIHHLIQWKYVTPCILNQKYKKNEGR